MIVRSLEEKRISLKHIKHRSQEFKIILNEVVDVTEETVAQRGNCIPMFEMNLQHNNRRDHAIEDVISCQAVGRSRDKGEETNERNGPKSAAIVMGKAARPHPPPDQLRRGAAEGTEA